MKNLLILSNSKNLSHIAIIDENSDEILNNLRSSINDEKSFKNYVFLQMSQKEYFVHMGEKADFSDIMENHSIQAIFTYFEENKNISFALKQEGNLIHYDLKEYLKENSFQTLEHLLKETNNANATLRENQSQLEFAGGRLQTGNRPSRTQNSQNASRNESGGVRTERGVSESNARMGETFSASAELGVLQGGAEQRGGIPTGEFSSAKPHTPNSLSSIEAKSQPQDIQSPESRDNDEWHRRERSKAQFRARIASLLQSRGIIQSCREVLQQIHRGANFSTRTNELSNPQTTDSNLNTRTEERGLHREFDRGAGGFESNEFNEANEFRGGNARYVVGGITQRGVLPESSQTLHSSSSTQSEFETSANEFPAEFSNSQTNSRPHSLDTKRKEHDNEVNANEEFNANLFRERTSRELDTSNDTDGISQIKTNETNTSDENPREADNTGTSTENQPLQQDISQTSQTYREVGSLQEQSEQNGQSTIYENEPTYNQTQSSNEGSKRSFRIFNEYEFVKKLEGKEYKGEIDFKLSKNQRIEANFKALYLLKDIFERKERVKALEFIERNELLDFVRTQNDGNDTQEYYEQFKAEKKARLKQEFKEKNYFSLDCPYNEEEQLILAKYSGFGGLKEVFYDEKFKARSLELEQLVGQNFFTDLKFSSFNAYFTPSAIIEAMYEGLKSLGVSSNEKITALEPSCGIGHFITKAPANYEFIAVEKDALSATIAKLLHPRTIIYNKAYEEVYFKREFDVIVANPPYENERAENSKELIHNFFVIKSQSFLKEGGLSSFVITSGFMDSKSNSHREKLMQDNFLLSAFRLPNSSFKNSHTEVLSDIVFLRKTEDKKEFFKSNSQNNIDNQLSTNEKYF